MTKALHHPVQRGHLDCMVCYSPASAHVRTRMKHAPKVTNIRFKSICWCHRVRGCIAHRVILLLELVPKLDPFFAGGFVFVAMLHLMVSAAVPDEATACTS